MNVRNYGIAVGRLTREPVIFTNRDGSRKVKFTIAAAERYRKSDGSIVEATQFINMDGFVPADRDKNGVYEYIHQGDLVEVQYTVRSNNYQKDGQTVFSQGLAVQSLQILAHSANRTAKAKDTANDPVLEDLPF